MADLSDPYGLFAQSEEEKPEEPVEQTTEQATDLTAEPPAEEPVELEEPRRRTDTNTLYFTPDMDRPNIVGTKATWFGGQRGRDPGDPTSETASGVSTKGLQMDYMALPQDVMKKAGLNFGDVIPLFSANDPDRVVPTTLVDIGPGRGPRSRG